MPKSSSICPTPDFFFPSCNPNGNYDHHSSPPLHSTRHHSSHHDATTAFFNSDCTTTAVFDSEGTIVADILDCIVGCTTTATTNKVVDTISKTISTSVKVVVISATRATNLSTITKGIHGYNSMVKSDILDYT
jgi:hypothetical protein